MSQTKKSLQDLTLLDRFLFAEVMEDAETFENVLVYYSLAKTYPLKDILNPNMKSVHRL